MFTPHRIAESFHSPAFEYVVLPLVTAVFMAFVKTQSKRVAPNRFTLQEMAIGLDLIFAGAVSFATYAASLSKDLVNYEFQQSQHADASLKDMLTSIWDKEIGLLYALMFSIIGLWLLSALVSGFGWKNERELNKVGIFAPLLASAIPFLVLGYYISS